MNKGRIIGLLVIATLVIIGVFLWSYCTTSWLAPLLGSGAPAQTVAGKATYSCDESKTIIATYYTGPAVVPVPTNTNGPPPPNGSVALILSDGRSMTLPQTISGSGIRYANADESFVFWSKGNTAFVTEGTGSTTAATFANCVATSTVSG